MYILLNCNVSCNQIHKVSFTLGLVEYNSLLDQNTLIIFGIFQYKINLITNKYS